MGSPRWPTSLPNSSQGFSLPSSLVAPTPGRSPLRSQLPEVSPCWAGKSHHGFGSLRPAQIPATGSVKLGTSRLPPAPWLQIPPDPHLPMSGLGSSPERSFPTTSRHVHLAVQCAPPTNITQTSSRFSPSLLPRGRYRSFHTPRCSGQRLGASLILLFSAPTSSPSARLLASTPRRAWGPALSRHRCTEPVQGPSSSTPRQKGLRHLLLARVPPCVAARVIFPKHKPDHFSPCD